VNAIVRLVLAGVAFIATYVITYWLPFAFLPDSVPSIVALVAALGCGVWAGRFVWRKTAVEAPGLLGAVVLGALITGGIGFCGGFFGPLIFRPDANQGPLLGILITGPLGFVLGGIGGGIYWGARGRHQ
jgi:hypothetical protein